MNKTKIALIAAVHVLVWILNYWFITSVNDFNWNGFSTASGSLSDAYTYGIFFNAFLFYIQIFWFVPKVYIHNKKVKFYIFSFSTLLVISLIETYFDYTLYSIYNIDTAELLGSFITNVIFHILYSMAGFYYIFRLKYKKSEKRRHQLLEEGYKTELKYLKAQLNPHFLFNGINSVYHLIGKNNELAKDTLLQFSELLRYQLYESETSILLEKELDYVSQYIKIEETRRGSDIQLDYNIEFESSTKKIAPLLLIPFIENAFKHCSNYTDKSTISIKIIEIAGTLTLNSTNSFEYLRPKNTAGGIGLTNVKRRLSLLYPNEHHLEIRKGKTNFSVILSINL